MQRTELEVTVRHRGSSVIAAAEPEAAEACDRPLLPRTAASTHLLVVASDQLQRFLLTDELELGGREVLAVDSGEAALVICQSGTFDLVILDGALAGLSGFEVLRRIRACSDVPVIMVLDTEALSARLAAFDLGADDVISKPLEVAELGRRVRAILRRNRNLIVRQDERLIGPGGIVMKVRAHTVSVGSEEVDLTPKEFGVLRMLLERRGEVVAPNDLSRAVWGYETFGSQNFVEAHLSRLRAKLARAGVCDIITTKRGVGYSIHS